MKRIIAYWLFLIAIGVSVGWYDFTHHAAATGWVALGLLSVIGVSWTLVSVRKK